MLLFVFFSDPDPDLFGSEPRFVVLLRSGFFGFGTCMIRIVDQKTGAVTLRLGTTTNQFLGSGFALIP